MTLAVFSHTLETESVQFVVDTPPPWLQLRIGMDGGVGLGRL